MPFSDSTSLKVNFDKSFLVPINMSHARADQLASVFGCNIGAMPFTYLGLPLSTRNYQANYPRVYTTAQQN
jgi:hypothetical protein